MPGNKLKLGRPQNGNEVIAFLQTCSYFQSNDEERLTISDLISVMKKFLEGFDELRWQKYEAEVT